MLGGKKVQRFNSPPVLALYVRHPHLQTKDKQKLVRELPKNRGPTEVSGSFSGSTGAVGRHNYFKLVEFPRGCHQHLCPHIRTLRAARVSHQSRYWSTLMKFRPLHDRVVVERIDADAKSPGGILIPDSAQEKPSQGEIVAVGPGGRDEAGKFIPIDLKKGDRVLFGKWSGTEVKIDGQDLLIMKECDIMGVLQETVAKKKAA
jgi:chaperonin GroES